MHLALSRYGKALSQLVAERRTRHQETTPPPRPGHSEANQRTPAARLFVFKQKTAYEITCRDWSSFVFSSDLVTVVNQKGYRVASMSEQELLDIFDARANMEAMLVSLAIARGGDEWEADVLAKAHLLSKLEACDASEKMLDEWDLRHQAFHTAIVAGCGSHYLLQMRERLFDLAARYRFIWLRRTVLSVEMLEDKHDQHQTLTAAVLARDTARASELMRQHLLTPIPIIQQAMAGN